MLAQELGPAIWAQDALHLPGTIILDRRAGSGHTGARRETVKTPGAGNTQSEGENEGDDSNEEGDRED